MQKRKSTTTKYTYTYICPDLNARVYKSARLNSIYKSSKSWFGIGIDINLAIGKMYKHIYGYVCVCVCMVVWLFVCYQTR